MAISKQLKACMLADFAYQYNKSLGYDYRVDIEGKFAYIGRPGNGGKHICTGHFIKSLMDYCVEHFGRTPCLCCYDDQIQFYI